MDQLRHVGLLGGFTLRTWATRATDHRGQTVIGYEFKVGDEVIFEGEDFAGSPLHGDDSDETLRALMGFLTLRPGDTDAEYFASYTADQLAFARSGDAEVLAIYAEEGGEPFTDLDGD